MENFNERLLIKLIFILFLNTSPVLAQEIEWQNTIGGSGTDKLYSIQQTADKGFILGGTSNSNISGDKTENGYYYEDFWIVKTDSLGNIQWQNTIGGNRGDELRSIQQTTDGGYIIGGYSNSAGIGDKSENSIGVNLEDDYWIVKTDSVGNILWENTIGGYSKDELYSIQQTTDGGYILGGFSESYISGDKTENFIGGSGGRDYWIVKVDSLGLIQWQNTIGGTNSEEPRSIKPTADGGYIIGGYSISGISVDKTENCLGGPDYWILKVDSQGAIQWQNTIGGSSVEYLHSFLQTTDGGYILGGYSWSSISGDKTENSIGGYDYWIVKVDPQGAIQWQNTIGGNVDDFFSSIQQTADGGYILGGHSRSNISGDKTENSDGLRTDYWIVKTDSLGNIQWQNTIQGGDQDFLSSIIQAKDGGYLLGGYSSSNIYGDKTENCIGAYDYWIIKLTDKYNLITGKLFSDVNSNGIHDSGESPILGRRITDQTSGRFTFSDQNGNYILSVLDTGNFTVSPQSVNWFNPSPVSHTSTFVGTHQTDSLNNFAFQPLGVFEDVCVTITPLGNFRSGFNASYMISYGNYGTTTVSNPSYIFTHTTMSLFNPQQLHRAKSFLIQSYGICPH
jgi:hypothetical protein